MRINSRVHYCRTAAASGVGNGVELVDVIDTVGFIFYMHILMKGRARRGMCGVNFIICGTMAE